MHFCLWRRNSIQQQLCTVWEMYSLGKLAMDFICSQLYNLMKFWISAAAQILPVFAWDWTSSEATKDVCGKAACLWRHGYGWHLFSNRKPSGHPCGLSVYENLGMGQWPGKIQVCHTLLIADNVWKTLDFQRYLSMHQSPDHRVIRNQNTMVYF